MKKTLRYIMYIAILIICVISVLVAAFNLEDKNGKLENTVIGETEKSEEKTDLEKFKELFTNDLEQINSLNLQIRKIDQNQPIIYEAALKEEKQAKYSIDVHLPAINIDSDVAKGYNNSTGQNFASRVEQIKTDEKNTNYTVYETNFACFINENVLSVAILGSLKNGDNAQRVLVGTYNFDLTTGKTVTISDIIQKRGLDTTAVNKKINNEIAKAQETSQTISQTGYDIYERNIEDEMYNISNTNNFIQGPDGELYLIYAYGNTNNTAELDVVQI